MKLKPGSSVILCNQAFSSYQNVNLSLPLYFTFLVNVRERVEVEVGIHDFPFQNLQLDCSFKLLVLWPLISRQRWQERVVWGVGALTSLYESASSPKDQEFRGTEWPLYVWPPVHKGLKFFFKEKHFFFNFFFSFFFFFFFFFFLWPHLQHLAFAWLGV